MAADVYWLESCITAYAHNVTEASNALKLVDRLALHRPTASYLLGYTVKGDSDATVHNTKQSSLPFRPCRFQYVAKVVAVGRTPEKLLDAINDTLRSRKTTHPSWLLSYDTIEPLCTRVSSTMLMCAVSRLLPGEPLLESGIDANALTFLILETSEQLYLVRRLAEKREEQPTVRHFREAWSKRPFQYSGAINIDVAIIAVDILSDILQIREATKEDKNVRKTIRILDPTCGSGTFLALAAMNWGNFTNIELTGVDSNPKCAQGTVSNLMNMLSLDGDLKNHGDGTDTTWRFELETNAALLSTATIHTGDSTLLQSKVLGEFDCVATNLPWNRNTYEFKGFDGVDPNQVNKGILQAVSSVLKPGGPMVVITADSGGSSNSSCEEIFDAKSCLLGLGFTILGSASVPPRGYMLPASKKQSKTTSGKKLKGSSNCSIIVALAP